MCLHVYIVSTSSFERKNLKLCITNVGKGEIIAHALPE